MAGTFEVLPVLVAVDPDEHIQVLMALLESNAKLSNGLTAAKECVNTMMKLETLNPEYLHLYSHICRGLDAMKVVADAQEAVINGMISDFLQTEEDEVHG